MKKILFAVMAAAAAAILVSCGASAPVKEAVAESTSEKTESMSFDAAAGEYNLTEIAGLGKDSAIKAEDYKKNTLTLTDDGEYEFACEYKNESERFDGKYEITPEGAVTLDGGNCISAKEEKIVCDGESVTVTGNLGSQIKLVMKYTREK